MTELAIKLVIGAGGVDVLQSHQFGLGKDEADARLVLDSEPAASWMTGLGMKVSSWWFEPDDVSVIAAFCDVWIGELEARDPAGRTMRRLRDQCRGKLVLLEQHPAFQGIDMMGKHDQRFSAWRDPEGAVVPTEFSGFAQGLMPVERGHMEPQFTAFRGRSVTRWVFVSADPAK